MHTEWPVLKSYLCLLCGMCFIFCCKIEKQGITKPSLVLTIGKLLLSLFAVSPQSGWAALTNTGSVHNATIKEVGKATVISSVSTRELLDANWWLAIDRSILVLVHSFQRSSGDHHSRLAVQVEDLTPSSAWHDFCLTLTLLYC